ncbi:hypothetical protein KGF57_003771 [Candida theae]|uniref:Phosphoribulokinase/uridine kinase domain-containing protein n=1 Tax=Candida theae TaxID=1198502 RepID=A0AAD5FXC5_9ASCO|nr:uncharacterized protein KGF57_003771 [Candida theae]KAI5954748.1 hypothetical protein KGF57_003771 [Candida theae]
MSAHHLATSIVVLLGGGHAAGKRTAALSIRDQLHSTMQEFPIDVQIINMNEYTDHEKSSVDPSQFPSSKSAAITVKKEEKYKFPILKPSRFNFEKLKHDLRRLDQSSITQKIVLVHGLYALYDKELRDMAHIKVFIDSDADTRLIRWIRRDVLEGKTENLETVINAYLLGARVEMSDYIFPTKEFCDVIMPKGPEPNSVSLVIDGILLYVSKNHQPQRTDLPSNYLRPSEIGNFEKERFDIQKNKFYQLN